MATNIRLKSSSVSNRVPTLSDLSLRELAINTTDGRLFLRKGNGTGTDAIVDLTDHGSFYGLGDDDHTQYFHNTITRTGVTAELNTTGKITTTASIGIGTANPVQKVTIVNAAKSLADGSLFALSSSDATNAFQFVISRTAAGAGSCYAIQSVEQNIAFRSISLNPNGGNVGIGTANPTSTTDIWGLQANTSATSASVPTGTLRLAFNGGENTGNYGASLVFSQKWFSGNTEQVATGQITGFKSASNGNYGGGLAFFTSNVSNTDLVERVRITSTGNVGIATTNPAATLHVGGSGIFSDGNMIMRNIGGTSALEIGQGQTSNQFALIDLIGDTTYTDYGLRILRGNTGANSKSNIYHRGTGAFELFTVDSAPIDFYINSGFQHRIDTSGNFLINTASATGTSNQKLQVNSGAYISGKLGIGTTTVASGEQVEVVGGGVRAQSLNAVGTPGAFASAGGIIAYHNGSGVGILRAYSDAGGGSGTLIFNASGSENARITSTGNFLISTTTATGTASQPLQVTGGAYVSGNVGIGVTNPGSKLAVNGYITESTDGTNYYNVVTQQDVGLNPNQIPLNQYLGQLAFMDEYSPSGLRRSGGGSDDVVVTSSGNIGIGSTTPGLKLVVSSNTSTNSPALGSGIVSFTNLDTSANNYSSIIFNSSDSTSIERHGAAIALLKDGTWTGGSGSYPGHLTFWTRGSSGDEVERLRIGSDGGIGIGGVNVAGYGVLNSKGITGATTAYGFVHQGVVASDVTNGAVYFISSGSTAAASFTLSTLTHFQAQQGTIGSGSTVTNQVGFNVAASLVGATNNYGYFASIPAGTNRWNFYAGGTAQNYFAGNVGIGTVVASAKLHVYTTSSASSSFVSQPTASPASYDASEIFSLLRTSADSNICFSAGDARLLTATITPSNELAWRASKLALVATDYIALRPNNGSEAVRITSSLNVGVGRTAPLEKIESSGAILTFGQTGNNQTSAGSFDYSSTFGSTRILSWGASGVAGNISFWTGQGSSATIERVRIDGSGNVGIGTTNPSNKVHIYSASGTSRIQIDSGSNNSFVGYDGSTNDLQLASSTNIKLQTGASYTEAVRISSTGNVGIGTTNPLARLSIGSGSISDGNIPVQINAPTGGLQYYGANNNGSYGALFGYDRVGFSGGVLRVAGATDNIDLVVNNTTRALSINPSANVGIGNTNPSYKLHIGTSDTVDSAYLKVNNTGGTTKNYRYISIPAKSTAAGVTDTKSVYVGRFYNGIHKVQVFSAGGFAEIGFDVTFYRNWGVSSIPGILVHNGYKPLITFHFQNIDNESYYVFISFAYNPNAPINTVNDVRLDIMSISNSGTFVVGTTPTIPTLNSSNQMNYGMVVNDAGRVGVGNNINPTTSFDGYGILRMSSASSFESQIISRNDTNDTSAAYFILDKSKGGAQVTAGDLLGTFIWRGMSTGGSIVNSTAYIQAYASGTGSTFIPAGLQFNASTSFTFQNTSNGSSLLTILSSGNVGIGSTNPTTKLDVAGNARIGGAESRSTSGLTVGFTNNSSLFTANSDPGDTGRMLSIVNESTTTNAMSVLGFRINPNSANANAMLDMKFVQTGATSTSALHYTFNHAGSFVDRFSILSNGYVGIGSTSPGVRLELGGETAQFPIALRIRNTAHATSKRAAIAFGSGGGYQILVDSQGNGTEDFSIYQANINRNVLKVEATTGNVHIGKAFPVVAPTELSVNGYISECTDGTNYYNVVSQQDVGLNPNQIPLNQYLGQLAFMDEYSPSGLRRSGGGSDDVFVSSSGLVGISTTVPSGSLDIASSGPQWGGFNYGTNLILKGARNNGLGILDFANSNPWWIGNGGGTLLMATMPALGDTTTQPAIRMAITSTGNVGIGITNPSTRFLNYINVDGALFTSTQNAGTGASTFAALQITAGDASAYYFINSQNRASDGGTRTATLRNDAGDLRLQAGGSVGITVKATTGNVGIDVASPTYKLQVNGSFAATTKSFVIDHPTKPGFKLRYGSLEGPENGVYIRGRLSGNNTIELPEYWTELVHEDSITVNLTPIGRNPGIHSVIDISNNTIVIESTNDVINCFFTVFAERKDVEKLITEYES